MMTDVATFGTLLLQGRDNYEEARIMPTGEEANNLWGVEVVQTTACPAGTALVLDTQKFGFVALRSGLEIISGYTNDDFQRNITRWAVEERFNIAV